MKKEILAIVASALIVGGIAYGANYINKPNVNPLSREEALIKLFAEKYDLLESDVENTISQESENHVAGIVELAPKGPGNVGGFLAAKVDGQWKLVFDGNGSVSCEVLREYNFPQEMFIYCYEPTVQ